MCGIVGVLAKQAVNQELYDALTVIQHRGQDAAGILTSDHDRVYLRKSNGLVRDAIRQQHMLRLKGRLGVGHVRYPTAGTDSAQESQPFYVNSPYGIGLVHNGNLTNTIELAEDLIASDLRHLNTGSDSEILLNVVAHELQRVGGHQLEPKQLFAALTQVYSRIRGAFAAVMAIHNYGLVGFRDPNGIRPLVYGKRKTSEGVDYMMASETIALDALGYEYIADVAPGEVVYITFDGNIHRQQCVASAECSPCIFEYIYLARPDSIIDGISVYAARVGFGNHLAKKIEKKWPDHDIDVVIPIPDTSRVAASALSRTLGLAYSEGFVKNRYIGRTFIMPEQKMRRSSVRLKLNAIRQEFSGKNVLLVDDSVVRGTTSQEIIQMAREAGARKVYFASAAPEIRHPNVYGIDMPTASELIAHNRNLDEITKSIGADRLIYQSIEDVYTAINAAAIDPSKKIIEFEDSVFTGRYITGDIDCAYLQRVSEQRNEHARKKQRCASTELIDDLN